MKSTILIGMGMLCCTLNSSAQQVINGGFEPAVSVTTCSDITSATYNASMGGGNRAISNMDTIGVADAACGKGNPIEGAHFVVLDYEPPVGNAISLKLDKPMTANKEYSLELSYKVPVGIAPATAFLKYGYSKDSTTRDSLVASIDQLTNETWKTDTLVFTPKVAAQYMWIELTTLGGDLFTVHVDDVKMLNIPQSINDMSVSKGLSLYPNPCSGSTQLTIDKSIPMPCTVELCDITGKVITQYETLSHGRVDIDVANATPGMYFVKLLDGQQQVYTAKLLVK